MHEKKIFLTFDDGPGPKTLEIAETLNRMGIKATFFMVGTNAEAMPWVAKRVSELGHEIGVHAYYHKPLKGLTSAQLAYEIKATADILEKITGKKPRLFRAAYGNLTPEALKFLKSVGLAHVDWSYDTKDWEIAQQGRYLDPKEIIAKAKPGDVILFHDGAAGHYASQAVIRGNNILRALPEVIRGLRQKGFEFEPIEQQYQKGQRLKYLARIKLKELRAKAKAPLAWLKKHMGDRRKK